MKVHISTEIDIADIHLNHCDDDGDTAKALIMSIDKAMEDSEFTFDIINALVHDLRKDVCDADIRDFLKKLRKELK